jgi:hypothetical protein
MAAAAASPIEYRTPRSHIRFIMRSSVSGGADPLLGLPVAMDSA